MDRVVITGGASGIGKHLALGYAEKGYEVFTLDVMQPDYKGEHIHFFQVDLCDEKAIHQCFQTIYQDYGPIHILINDGAISKFHKPVLEMTVEEFDKVISTNLRGTFLCCQEFIQCNKGAGYGRIVNFASTRHRQNQTGWEAYGASKGGVVSFTNTLCVSLSNTGITVNVVSPGWIQVENYDKLKETDHTQHPSGRVGTPQDVVHACLFLTSRESDFINGVNLYIDGGITKKLIFT